MAEEKAKMNRFNQFKVSEDIVKCYRLPGVFNTLKLKRVLKTAKQNESQLRCTDNNATSNKRVFSLAFELQRICY